MKPDVSWKKEGGTPRRRRLPHPQGTPRRCAPGPVQVLSHPLYGGRYLRALSPEEAHDPWPVSAGRLPRPQVHVEKHPIPAGELAFQFGLQGVPLAQEETVHRLLSGLRAWRIRFVERASNLAATALAASFRCLLPGHEKRLLYPPHPVSPVLRGRAEKWRLEEAPTRSLLAAQTDIKRSERSLSY